MAAIHARCFEAAPRPWSAAEFAALSESPGIVIVETTGGFAIGRVAGPEAELLTLAVDPPNRRQGCARFLLEALHAELTRHGVEEIFLEVAENNGAARALYNGCGYHEAGRRRSYYTHRGRTAVDALVLSREISNRDRNS